MVNSSYAFFKNVLNKNNLLIKKESYVTKSFSFWTKKQKEQYYILTPARIWVNGDFAYVHYYYTQVMESSDGKPTTEKGRWTDILMKKNGKWMLVGDHGGEVKMND